MKTDNGPASARVDALVGPFVLIVRAVNLCVRDQLPALERDGWHGFEIAGQ